jgi:hypothetical protein
VTQNIRSGARVLIAPMHRWSIVVLALASCGDREAASQVVAPKAISTADLHLTPAPPPTPAVHAPHGGAIALVALTDAADAALTVDEQDRVRLWPTLDGTHEPVVVRASAARQLALLRDQGELVAAILDEVGGLELLRHDAGGALRDRARISTEPAIVQVIAAGAGFLARRSDHTMLWIDGAARVRGTLVPEPGEQVVAIAARRATALAAIADPARPEIAAVRRIELRDGVRWGARFTLPEPMAEPIAVSPSGNRVVGLSARTGLTALIVELAATPSVLAREAVFGAEDERVVGFLDDKRVVLPGGVGFEIGAQPPSDPWGDRPDRERLRFARGGAIADRVVSSLGTALAISTPDRTAFLGYRDHAVGSLQRTVDGTALVVGRRVLWLDDRLRVARTTEVAEPNKTQQLLVLDAMHALRVEWDLGEGEKRQHRLVLVETPTGKTHDLGLWPLGTAVAYDPRTRVLINSADPHTDRLQVDFATGTATPLRPFKTSMYAAITPVDPAHAGGVVAVAYGMGTAGGHVLETFTDDGRRGRGPIAPSTRLRVGDQTMLGIDRTGAAWALVGGEPQFVYAFRKGKRVARFAVPTTLHGGTVAADGSTVIAFDMAHVIGFDPKGHERWRVPAWHATAAELSPDGAVVFLATRGGLVTLDAATGRRLGAACGWGFGLSETEPNQVVFGDAPVCAEGAE